MKFDRCMGCMREIKDGETVCPACGNVHEKEKQPVYALRCGTILHGKYLMGKTMGQGGFGITYVGFDMVLNMKVAIKEYFPMNMAMRENSQGSSIVWNTSAADRESRENGYNSFLKEARKMAKVDAIPAVVSVRDMFLENETAYIVMGFVEGETLKAKLMREGPMAYSDCVRLLMPVMEALERVHQQNIIHRDISPDNIMIQPDGTVKLLDLGAAKEFDVKKGDEQMAQSSQLVTKRGFSPLEQYMDAGQIGSWTDVYALSATIYYCITGKLLPSSIDRLQEEELVFPQNMKEPLSEQTIGTLKEGLALRPEKRIQTMAELKAKLNGQENKKRESGKGEEKSRKKNLWMPLALAELLLMSVFFCKDSGPYLGDIIKDILGLTAVFVFSVFFGLRKTFLVQKSEWSRKKSLCRQKMLEEKGLFGKLSGIFSWIGLLGKQGVLFLLFLSGLLPWIVVLCACYEESVFISAVMAAFAATVIAGGIKEKEKQKTENSGKKSVGKILLKITVAYIYLLLLIWLIERL